MKGITFDTYHSYRDFNLILQPGKEIGSPSVKVKKIDVEGADSSIDYTDVFGVTKYDNLTHKFTFATKASQSEFLSLFSTVKNALHGKKMRIILDDDPSFYYIGRLTVLPLTNQKNIGYISIEADCEPYKYKLKKTVVSATLDGTSSNIYDFSKVTLVSTAIKKQADEYFFIDAVNNGTTWQYITFFHNPFAAGEVAPNQNTTIIMETKDFEVSGTTETRMFFTSINEGQPDYFSPASFSTNLITHDRKTAALYPAPIKDEATISKAVYFIRSFIALAPGSKCKGKFRLSILPGDVRPHTYTYVSHDGGMKGLQLINSKKRVVPTITANGAFTLYHEGNEYSITAGTTTIPEIELKEGVNDIAVKGTGTISFEYQEGVL